MLTRKQNELLMFINKRLNDDGVSPSFDEMKEALRLKSKSGIHRLITGLEERGFLRRLPHRARALQVLKLPDTAAMPAPNVTPLLADARRAGLAEAREGFVPQIVRGDRLPLAGAIQAANEAAGPQPAALWPDRRRYADRGAAGQFHRLWTCPSPCWALAAHYCLEVQGDSMVEAGIQNGDIAIIKERRHRRVRRDRRGADRRHRGDAEAPAQEGRFDCPGARERRLRDADLRAGSREDPGRLAGLYRRYN